MDLVNNYIYILEIPINIISKLRSLLRYIFETIKSLLLKEALNRLYTIIYC
jgi:hypothetical protein